MNVPTIYEMAFLPFLFAQGDDEPTAANAGGGAAEAPAGGEGSFMQSLWFPILIVCGVYLLLMMIPRNDQKKRKEQLDRLKKNDKVITAGGIFGTVASIKQDDPFLMLRVDESTNARMKILKTSISTVISNEEKNTESESSQAESPKKL